MAGSDRPRHGRTRLAGNRGRLGRRLPSVVLLGLAALCLTVSHPGTPGSAPADTPVRAFVPPPAFAAAPGQPALAGLPAEYAPPAELTIASIGVRSPLVDLNRNPDGSLTVPADYRVAGWYANGPTPGEAGGPPAVIAGHVDSTDGPAVFYRLRDLKTGSEIAVRGIDNVVRHFTVYRLADYAKTAFPADEVYAPTGKAELRLITCTGDFDRRAGSYRSNLVAYAVLTKDGS
ncbi:class F sortase [Micromonospora sp. NBC_01699]|uniref:class F sortase n=1 Tax=Micromonospora sp. NBC_01699 TaxID=2975984 RepID=UPI002E2A8C34|nr:class F sortase [Micromonospora sp. NBC_01699]